LPRRTDIHSVALIGSGPIVIGQACEFDYSGSQALRVLRAEGMRTVLINSNPATIMTDRWWADRTYLEPLDLEGATAVLRKERPDALLPTLGGQTALNLASDLYAAGVLDELGIELIGASYDAIRRAEDRELFAATVAGIGLRVPTPPSSCACPWSSGPPSRSAGTAAASPTRRTSSRRRSHAACARAPSARCCWRSRWRGGASSSSR
jgi:carbamoylphosphate synthase large subunit